MINKVILVGRVGADPEIRTLESGVNTARIRVATTENILDKTTNTWEQRTEWHTVILWRNLADVADKFVRKGSLLYVEGTVHYRKWQGKDGVEHSMTDITATELKMLNKVEVAEQTEPQYQPVEYPTPVSAPAEPEVIQDDLPF